MEISKFSGEYSFLSNFYPCKVLDVHWGVDFPSAEHMFQSRKTFNLQEKLMIRDCKTPGRAKRMGKKISLREDWEEIRVDVMYDVLISKFHQNPDLARKLKETGDAELIEENVWHDKFWGICLCFECKNTGENWLGRLLMDIRKFKNL